MNQNTPRSNELLNKVFDRLEKVDLEKLDMREMKDFLEVVREGQFLESYGKIPSYPGGFGLANPFMRPAGSTDTSGGTDDTNTEEK